MDPPHTHKHTRAHTHTHNFAYPRLAAIHIFDLFI